MAICVFTSLQQVCDDNGDPLSSGTVTVQSATTTTPLSCYTNTGLSIAATNPIPLDSAGRHTQGMVYIAAAAYKCIAKNSSGVTIWTRDSIDPGVPIGSGALAIANGGTGSTTAAAALSALGAATAAELADVSADVAALAGALSSVEKTHIATGTTAQRPTVPVEGDMRRNTTLSVWEGRNGNSAWETFSVVQPTPGMFRGLSITNNSGTPNTKIDVASDFISVQSAAGISYLISALSVTIDASTTGANALDAGSLGNSTWYYIWVIYNPTTSTAAALASTSSTAPTLPSGYTAKARYGSNITDGSAHFRRVKQLGRLAQYVVGTNPTVVPNIANGVAGTWSATSPTLTTASITGVVPPTASRIHVLGSNGYTTATAASMIVAPNTAWGGTNNGPNGSAGQVYPISLNAVANNVLSVSAWLELEATTIAWASSAAGGAISCLGWEDNL